MTNTAWVLNFAGWRSQKDMDKSASLDPLRSALAGNNREELPARRLLPWHLPLCSYSEILQLPLPYLVAGTVLCLAEPPGPRRPRPGPARLQRATPPGPRASRGHAHVRSSCTGRVGRGSGRELRERRGSCPQPGSSPGSLRSAPAPPRLPEPQRSPSRPSCVCKPLVIRQRKMKLWSSSVKTHRFLSCFPLFFRTGYSVFCGDFTGAFCREKETLNTATYFLKSYYSVMLCEERQRD